MSVILQMLVATILIAGMILARLAMSRRALRARIRGADAGGECTHVGCFNGCSKLDEAAADDEDATGPKT